ncbi:pinin/SDK/memA/ protein conserved region-domain-containing protein [Triangularia verruculosa]|uniref:Pinin/SDK/memA/ protein conserved region-domain-containing protein n=1 Tax=Triangularia verruculosa TaxID=2587418 RepID=A0AAN7AT60_9PEZI|nr:pinin/SDK/memA/ protein conserved region-domain-containing protein [Triangularia verruculosa]
MADFFEDAPSTNKRKASPSPSPSNAPAKRSRVDLDGPERYGDSRPGYRRDSIGYSSRSRSPIHHRQSFSRRDSYGRDRPPPLPQEPIAPPPRKAVTQEERKRGQRLFGGILGTLSGQTGSNNNLQKRRLDIEKRQHERAQKQEVEDQKRWRERQDGSRRERLIRQIETDERIMHAQHEELMTAARSLMTRSHPRILYRPWKLTREQERTVRDQVHDAEDRIDRELAEWKREKERRYRALEGPVPASTRPREEYDRRNRDRRREPAPVANDDGTDDNRGEQDSREPKDIQMEVDDQPKKEDQTEEKDEDSKRRNSDQHHDEVMMQDAEDTVIY